jgi:hypothetical protein
VTSPDEPVVVASNRSQEPNKAEPDEWEDNTMTSLYVWKAYAATVCRFHRTPSDWDYEPLSAIDTQEFVRMLQAEGLARVSACEPCEMGYGGKRPGGPLTFAEAVLTA